MRIGFRLFFGFGCLTAAMIVLATIGNLSLVFLSDQADRVGSKLAPLTGPH